MFGFRGACAGRAGYSTFSEIQGAGLGLGLLLGALGVMGVPGIAGADAPTTIAILGSSTAAGTGATNYDSAFAGRYEKYLGALNPSWKLKNYAVGGYTTYHIMPTGYQAPAGRPAPDTARNITQVLRLKPHALLISMPSNDINNGYPASEFNDNFDSLHAWATRAGIPVWIATPLPRSALDADKRKILLALRDRIIVRYAPRVINFYDSLGDENGNYFSAFNSGDGIHTNDRGHKILFQRVVAANLPGLPVTSIFASAAGSSPRVSSGLPKLVLDPRSGLTLIEGFRRGSLIDLRGRSVPLSP
jgi:lysophospholipase L1-like esterase